MSMNRLPVIGVTIGDPAGIGPEVACKLLLDDSLADVCEIILIGYESVIRETFENVLKVDPPELFQFIEPEEIVPVTPNSGEISAENGKASMLFVETAVTLCQNNLIDAITTCPINKKSIQLAGYPFPGHTEYLQHLTGAESVTMMLVGHKVRVTLVTTHLPIAKVAKAITKEAVLRTILTTQDAGTYFGTWKPRIAVCGLNPHAGDHGALGTEDDEIIAKAIEEAQSYGILATGPYPADSLFPKVLKGEFDFVVVMYHDQGLIPVKMEAFGSAVNVSLSLPVVRTSVDHGTAFDIAGKNVADYASLKNAVRVAAEMVQHAQLT